MLEKIKLDLPNFPDEIIADWLEPYAKEIGWPPVHNRWFGILFGNDLEFWKSVRWEKQVIDIFNINMSKITNDGLIGMNEAFVLGKKNEYSTIENGKERHDRAFRYFVKYGKFPKPICLLKEGYFYSVVDGNHRILALKTFRDTMIALEKAPSENREKFNEVFLRKLEINEPAKFSSQQEVWVATLGSFNF